MEPWMAQATRQHGVISTVELRRSGSRRKPSGGGLRPGSFNRCWSACSSSLARTGRGSTGSWQPTNPFRTLQDVVTVVDEHRGNPLFDELLRKGLVSMESLLRDLTLLRRGDLSVTGSASRSAARRWVPSAVASP